MLAMVSILANDSLSSADIVIVAPKPDASLLSRDEFSYSNLYTFDFDPADMKMGVATTNSDGKSSPIEDSNNPSSSTVSTSAQAGCSFESAFNELAKRNSFNNLAAACANASSPSSSPRSSINKGSNVNNEDTPSSAANNNDDKITRDPRNGAFTFQVNAEYDMLLGIQKDLDAKRRPSKSGRSCSLSSLALGDIEATKIILKSIDDYCYGKQWMYHIGSEKGCAIARFLRGGVEEWMKKKNRSKKFICVDCGTYCGYSSLVLASTLRTITNELQNSISEDEDVKETFEFHIYTTEVSSKLINVAQSVFRMAKMEQYITPILMKENGNNEESLSAALKDEGVTEIDFLLLDHAKHLYLSDLNDVESSGLLKAGSRVAADNVIFNKLDSYRAHMRQMERRGIVETRLDEMNLEYSSNLKDGIEMSVYIKDP